MDYALIQKEIKRAQKLAKPFSEQVAPIYKQLGWFWYRLGKPPEPIDLENQLIYFIKSLEIDESFSEKIMETGGIGIKVVRDNSSISITLFLIIEDSLIDALNEL